MFKRIFLSVLTFFSFAFVSNTCADEITANITTTSINVFVRENCRHCADEEAFLEKLTQKRDNLEINYYDIGEKKYKEQFNQITELEGISKTTPITLVGNVIIQGFDSAETTGKRIENLIDSSQKIEAVNFEEYIAAGGSEKIEIVENAGCNTENSISCEVDTTHLVTVPFFGVINLQKYSLGTMSILLGFVDGFNPCAMWVLVTFLLVLVQIGNRKKMVEIALLFILAEAIMYYLILNVWLTTWNFVGLDNIITPIVGVVSIGGACFFLYEFWTNDGTCKVTSLEQRRKTTQKIHKLIESPMTWLTAVGVISLALSVNVIEFACSIGIPQAFTKILNLNHLSALIRQFYLLIYTFFYMVDDFIIFGIALYSIEKIGITHKYARWTNLVGGIAMLILGGLLIFNPTALLF